MKGFGFDLKGLGVDLKAPGVDISADRHGVHTIDFTDEIMANPKFLETLHELAEETGRTDADVQAEAKASLSEMAAEQNQLAIGAWDKLCRWLGRAYKLDVDDEAIERLAQLNKDHTLVFLPNHRSYLDPLVLRSALDKHGFKPNHVLGGVNLSFWPMGPIARRNGIVFIRRQFRDAPVYRAALCEYMAYLVRNKQNMEWYIEGGRTRTGKLREPRYGILSYLIDAFDDDSTEDCLLIPVFVAYDQQHEVSLISEEEQGGTKTPEDVSWLVKFARGQSKRLGRARLRFGEPLSLREALDENKAEGKDVRHAVPKVAFEVLHRINEVTPIMPTALVTFALLDNDDRALTLSEGREILEPVLRYAARRGLDVTSDTNLSDDGGIIKALDSLISQGIVTRFDSGIEPVYTITPNRQHEAAFYRNTLAHFFITRAIVEIGLVRAAEENAADFAEVTWEQARALRDTLKFEFFFPRTRVFAEDVQAEAAIAYPAWESDHLKPDQLLPLLATSRLFTAPRILGPFLEAYSVAADWLAQIDPKTEIDNKVFIEECIGIGQQRWLQRRMHTPESVSKDLFQGALRLAANKGLVDPAGPALKKKRKAFAAELAEAVRRVDVIRKLASETFWEGK